MFQKANYVYSCPLCVVAIAIAELPCNQPVLRVLLCVLRNARIEKEIATVEGGEEFALFI